MLSKFFTKKKNSNDAPALLKPIIYSVHAVSIGTYNYGIPIPKDLRTGDDKFIINLIQEEVPNFISAVVGSFLNDLPVTEIDDFNKTTLINAIWNHINELNGRFGLDYSLEWIQTEVTERLATFRKLTRQQLRQFETDSIGTRRMDFEKKLRDERRKLKAFEEKSVELAFVQKLADGEIDLIEFSVRGLVQTELPSRPKPQPYGVSPQGAELICQSWMLYLGFQNVEVTESGPDGGFDLVCDSHIAQVKNFTAGAIGVQVLRELFGIANFHHRHPILFISTGLTESANLFSADAGIAVFRYDAIKGELEYLNEPARAIFATRSTRSKAWAEKSRVLNSVWAVKDSLATVTRRYMAISEALVPSSNSGDKFAVRKLANQLQFDALESQRACVRLLNQAADSPHPSRFESEINDLVKLFSQQIGAAAKILVENFEIST